VDHGFGGGVQMCPQPGSNKIWADAAGSISILCALVKLIAICRFPARRQPLFALLASLFISGGQVVRAEPPKPDILLLMPDQMRGDCLSLLAHPAVRTPQLDKLAQEGALFRRAYSTCPSCIPARASLLTGLFPATSGVVGYAARPISYPTLPKLLGDAGYTTLLVGRYMHQKPQTDSYGYQKEIRGSTYVANDDYDNFLKQAAPDTGGIRNLVATLGVSFNGWAAKPWPLADDLHPTAWIVTQARKSLKNVPAGQPLFLTASFYAPHPPLFPPKRYFDAYAARKLPEPAHGDWVDWKALSPKGDKGGHRVLLEGDPLRATEAGYFGLIQHLDEQIVPLIAEFKERSAKARRPWVIIVTSDHGEMLGDHGFFRKCEPFEGAANIPFLVAGSPDLGFKPGLRSTQPVCLEDVMPTLLELAGASCPKPMDGISLVPVLRGEKRVLRDWLHSEHAPCYSQQQAFHALTDGHIKYIWRPLDGTEYLFDLDKDPREEHDLAKVDSQRASLEQWRGRLIKRLANRPEGFSDGTKLIPGRPYPALQARKAAKTPVPNSEPANKPE
jgi:arylsulfatase